MEYNTHREKLIVPEYGRNIQKMVEKCMTIEDRTKRNRYAQQIVLAMGQVNPSGKENPNYFHKLWDHLFIISDYKLDVDSPFPKPIREEKDEKPSPLHYKDSKIKYRPYGILLQNMIEKVSLMPDGEKKALLTGQLAQELKKAYLRWNIDTTDDKVIEKHLEELSSGRLHLPEGFEFKATKDLITKKTTNSKQKSVPKKKKQNNNPKK